MTAVKRHRNPPWNYDELVLAMDLYVRRGLADVSDPEVIELSALLNRLRKNEGDDASQTLRNPSGVHLKLCNFRAKDQPGHGMTHGNHLEHDVWDRFSNKPDDLSRAANVIRWQLRLSGSSGPLNDTGVETGRAAPDELLISLTGPIFGDVAGATVSLMTLIREAAGLANSFATLPQGQGRADSAELRDRLNILRATLVQVEQQLGVSTAVLKRSPAAESTNLERGRGEYEQTGGRAGRKVVILPCGDPSSVKHFNRTVRRPVDLTVLDVNLDRWAKLLPPKYSLTEARVWGVMPRGSGLNETRFKQTAVGDIALFTGGRKVFSAATILAKLQSAELARALWHTDRSGRTWELVFLLADPIELQIPYEILNSALGYSPNFAFQAFSVLNAKVSGRAKEVLETHLGHVLD